MGHWRSWERTTLAVLGPGVQVPYAPPRRSKVRFAPFFYAEKLPPAPLLLLFREKSRSVRLLVCKRTRDGSQSLPTFHDYAPSAQNNPLDFTVFARKSCKDIRVTTEQVYLVLFFYGKNFVKKTD